MKLAPLLAQYLYTNKRLDLPGIGRFILDPGVLVDLENSKQQKSSLTDGISFQSEPGLRESPDLIAYISQQSGKMKALAAADLDSHLELVQQFLNIGKPFLLEGIGSLIKVRSGEYEFTPGALLPLEKVRDTPVIKNKEKEHDKENDTTPVPFGAYNPLVGQERSKLTRWRKPLMAILIVAGGGLALWGGYTVYKKNETSGSVTAAADSNQTTTVLVSPPDTGHSSPSPIGDTITTLATPVAAPAVQYAATPAGNLKFVLETAGRVRAFERYNKLKAYLWDVKMETTDSVQFKLFMLIPGNLGDSTRLMDSLTLLNGRRVYIE